MPTPKAQIESGAALPAPGTERALYLVDISGYVFRAFYALPPLTQRARRAHRGPATGSPPCCSSWSVSGSPMLAVVMDWQGPSFRKELYSEYKAQPPGAPPDDLK